MCICCAFVHSGPLWVCYPLREAGRGGIYLKWFFCSWNVPPCFQLFNRHLFLLFTSAWHNANIYHLGVKYLLAFTPPQDAHGHPSIGYYQRTYMIMYRDCFYVYACMHACIFNNASLRIGCFFVTGIVLELSQEMCHSSYSSKMLQKIWFHFFLKASFNSFILSHH